MKREPAFLGAWQGGRRVLRDSLDIGVVSPINFKLKNPAIISSVYNVQALKSFNRHLLFIGFPL